MNDGSARSTTRANVHLDCISRLLAGLLSPSTDPMSSMGQYPTAVPDGKSASHRARWLDMAANT
ncbi:MAG: hypothetical protein ACTH7C_13960, partial [Cobetia marina]